MEVTGSLFDRHMGGVPSLIDLIGLITSTDFNRLSINLKLTIIISVNSHYTNYNILLSSEGEEDPLSSSSRSTCGM